MPGRGQRGSHRVLLETDGGPSLVKRCLLFKEVVIGALGRGPKGTTKSLGSKSPKKHQPLHRERQSLPLSAGRTMSLGSEA